MATERERKVILNIIGQRLAELFPNLYGNVRFNFKAGRFINANIEECFSPADLEKEKVDNHS